MIYKKLLRFRPCSAPWHADSCWIQYVKVPSSLTCAWQVNINGGKFRKEEQHFGVFFTKVNMKVLAPLIETRWFCAYIYHRRSVFELQGTNTFLLTDRHDKIIYIDISPVYFLKNKIPKLFESRWLKCCKEQFPIWLEYSAVQLSLICFSMSLFSLKRSLEALSIIPSWPRFREKLVSRLFLLSI